MHVQEKSFEIALDASFGKSMVKPDGLTGGNRVRFSGRFMVRSKPAHRDQPGRTGAQTGPVWCPVWSPVLRILRQLRFKAVYKTGHETGPRFMVRFIRKSRNQAESRNG